VNSARFRENFDSSELTPVTIERTTFSAAIFHAR
jgi:hypothetical protein